MAAPATMTFVLLAMVVGMYWLASVARKKLGIGAGTVAPDQLKVVGKRQLDARKSLYVVEVADRYILVGTAENSVALIDHITADEFARMADGPGVLDADGDDEPVAARPQLATAPALSGIVARLKPGTRAGRPGDGDSGNAAGDGAPTASRTGADPRFATVGESFGLLLDKARSRRATKAEPASSPVPTIQD